MKIRFFSLLVVLIIVITGFIVYINVNKGNTASKDTSADHITTMPTKAPIPSVTPIPTGDSEQLTDLYPAYKITGGNTVFGYINSTGEFQIKPSFNIAGDYHDGLAVTYMDDQYLAIDQTGNIVYLSDTPIGDFKNGAAIISRYSGEETVYGYIDSEGEEIIKPQYKLASDFGSDDTAYVYSGDGKYAQIDKKGKIIKSFELDKKYNPTSIQDGYIIYSNSDSLKYGVVNLQGEEIIKQAYVEVIYLGNDLFSVKKPDDNYFGQNEAIPAALFNGKGEQLTDFNLHDVSHFHNGYASATDSTYTYFIGTDGKEVSDLPKFEGRGTLTLYGDVIKAEIDGDLIYYKKDKTVIWQTDTTQTLSDGIVAKQVRFKANKYVVVDYPQIEGLKNATVQDTINAELKSLFTDSRKGLKESDCMFVQDSFEASLIKNLLIVTKNGYDYNFGAAHGSPIMDYYYIDITNGTFYKFKDLFIEGSGYADKFNEIISKEIDAQMKNGDAMYFEGAFKGIAENPCFILTESSLTIYFYPYDIAAYAAGFPQFKISFEDIYDYIDFNGAFWGSFN